MASTPAPSSSVTSGPVALPPVGELVGGRRRRWRKPENPISLAIRLVLLLVASVIFIYPFVWSVSASLKPRENVFDNKLIPTHWQFWNYLDVFRGVKDQAYTAPFAHWFFNSMYIGILAAVTVTISSALVAFAFAYFRFPGRNFLFACVLGTMMLPGAVLMIPRYLIWNKLGLASSQYPLWAPNLFASAFYIFLMRQFFLGIPRELFEAARMDGDTYFSMFRRIVVPISKPALIVTAVFEFKASWTNLMDPLIYLRDDSQFTVPRGLYAMLGIFGPSGGGHGDYQVIMAALVIATIPMIIIFFLGQRYFVEGIATQGRKG
jgi:multiple sugar transport system permease protein